MLGADPVTIAENIRLLRESGLSELEAVRRAHAQARQSVGGEASAENADEGAPAPYTGIFSRQGPSSQVRALADAAEAEADVDAKARDRARAANAPPPTTRAPKKTRPVNRIRGGTYSTPR
jgi:hypothetical protein